MGWNGEWEGGTEWNVEDGDRNERCEEEEEEEGGGFEGGVRWGENGGMG